MTHGIQSITLWQVSQPNLLEITEHTLIIISCYSEFIEHNNRSRLCNSQLMEHGHIKQKWTWSFFFSSSDEYCDKKCLCYLLQNIEGSMQPAPRYMKRGSGWNFFFNASCILLFKEKFVAHIYQRLRTKKINNTPHQNAGVKHGHHCHPHGLAPKTQP
jgi:hypothetical protein